MRVQSQQKSYVMMLIVFFTINILATHNFLASITGNTDYITICTSKGIESIAVNDNTPPDPDIKKKHCPDCISPALDPLYFSPSTFKYNNIATAQLWPLITNNAFNLKESTSNAKPRAPPSFS